MAMQIFEAYRNEFFISTDKDILDIDFIHHYLSCQSYWAENIPAAIVKKSIEGSCCFGLYVVQKISTGATDSVELKQIGFARVISDLATFAYLADVFVSTEYRGRGLAVWLMEKIMEYPQLQGLRRWLLATRDAHGLYAKFGFSQLDKPERIMGLKPFDTYPKPNS